MPMADIEIKGLEGIFKRLDRLADVSQAEAAMERACALVEGEAKKNAPKGTGELRNSIQSRVENDNGDLVGIVFSPLEYAPYVEYGTGLFAEEGGRKDVPWNYQDDEGEWHSTRGMKPHPYLRPALADNQEKILEILGGSIGND